MNIVRYAMDMQCDLGNKEGRSGPSLLRRASPKNEEYFSGMVEIRFGLFHAAGPDVVENAL
jgi:hypothetical protein